VLVTPESDRRNRRRALQAAALFALGVLALGVRTGFVASSIVGTLLGFVVYWTLRRRCLRRLVIMKRPFPGVHEAILNSRVAFYRALDDEQKARFRQLVQVFPDEVRVTGVRTDVDETTRILVAASAIIPIFGFHDWDYHRLSEVLVYPATFNRKYKTEGKAADRDILGLTGLGHLSGVVILSKPALIEGFANTSDKQNVGVHEFAHLVEQEEVTYGLPPEVPANVICEWVAFVDRELTHPEANKAHINQYGYTNEHEFLAVLTEYFFESPETLKSRDPVLYDMLRQMFHQDPAALMSRLLPRLRVGRNAPCPCGSGKKFKDCCEPGLGTTG
jgi:Mlc titration factor MtfA (ptsG expression regulator)